jgi:hypothetical protein
MTHLSGAANWADWDQRAVLPARRRGLYDATFFPKLGSCASHRNISRQYAEVLLPNAAVPGQVGPAPGVGAVLAPSSRHPARSGWRATNEIVKSLEISY